MSYNRKLNYLNTHRIVYRRFPKKDKPDVDNSIYMYYINGTHECYELFRSAAKITTYKSLKWHLLVLWYLNPQLDQDNFKKLAEYIVYKSNGFVTFNVGEKLLDKIVYEVSMLDLDEPPKNKDDIYECMLDINDLGKKITINKIAKTLNCSSRTIHRNIGVELKREKELLNRQNEKI